MKLTSKTRFKIQLQNNLSIVLITTFISLLAWLSTRYQIQADWTLSNRYTLSEESQKLLVQLKEPVTITAYASKDEKLRQDIKELVERYQKHKRDISLRFVDPFTVPGEVKERGVQKDGELIIDYQKRSEHLRPEYSQKPTEQEMSTALQRVTRTDNRRIVFLQGHGEPSPKELSDQDMSNLSKELEKVGFEVNTLNFAQETKIPEKTNILVIANPQSQLLPKEVEHITQYLDQGGNILWLLDTPGELHGLAPLAEKLGLTIPKGLIIDPVSQLFGSNNPSVVAVATEGYGHHAVTLGLEKYLTFFPQVVSLKITAPQGWKESVLLKTLPQAWLETDKELVEFTEGKDTPGPINMIMALEHDEETSDSKKPKQRIIVAGDADFLTNAFLYGGNLNLAMRMMNWLSLDDTLVNIPVKIATDLELKLANNQLILLGTFFLFVLPMSLISTGLWVWWRRRKA